jgi:hypothetical protein
MKPWKALTLALLLVPLFSCAPPPGAVAGKITHPNGEPVAGAFMALCQLSVAEDGSPVIPDRFIVGGPNPDNPLEICTLSVEPTASTDSDGDFHLEGVPPGTYLLLYHLFPEELDEAWPGTLLTTAGMCTERTSASMVTKPVICKSGNNDFWHNGGLPVGGVSWSTQDGFVQTDGDACSNSLGFCLGLQEERLANVVEVRSEQTEEIAWSIKLRREKKPDPI